MLNIIKKEEIVNDNLISYSYPTYFELYFNTKKYILAQNKFLPYEKNDTIFMNIFGTGIPGINLPTETKRWMGGYVILPSGPITFNNWEVSFLIDEKMGNYMYLNTWMLWMNNNKDIYSQDNQDYRVDARLVIKDNWKRPCVKIKFIGIFPNDLGGVTLSTKDNSTISNATCTFSYTRYEQEGIYGI